jgi:hypothetical protein
MATYVKFQDFVERLGLAVHDLDGDTLKAALIRSTDPPQVGDTVLGDMTQPTGTGYTALGEDVQNSWAEAAGTGTLTGTEVQWVAGAADWSSFRYVVLHNDDKSDRLIAYWDYLGDITLGNGESFTVRWNGGSPTGTIFTLT